VAIRVIGRGGVSILGLVIGAVVLGFLVWGIMAHSKGD
jgi:hypothetical protein